MTQPNLEIALHLLATGLLEAIDAKQQGKEKWILNSKLTQALNHICAYQILRDGIPTIGGNHDLYTKAHESLSAIDQDLVNQTEEDSPLLDYFDEPTWLCDDLSISHKDIVGEIQQRVILKVRSLAMALGRPDLYQQARRWVAEHPIITQKHIEEACNKVEALGLARGHLEKFYEHCPAAEQLNLCSRCGHHYDPEGCGRSMCSPWKPQQKTEEIYRVNHGVAMFLVRPAIAELWLFDQLTQLGLKPELWPENDAYDLRVEVAGKIIAIDVKDAKYPKLLALRLNDDKIPNEPPWDEAYFVLPPWRDSSDYRHVLQVHLKAGVPLLWANQLIERIRKEIGK